jgi:hypothetical protein
MLGVAEQRCEAGIVVEARPAEPVDGAVAGNERRGLAIANEAVILDGLGHAPAYPG